MNKKSRRTQSFASRAHISYHRIIRIINLTCTRLIEKYHLFSVINNVIYCPNDSSAREDMNKGPCRSLPTSGLCTFRSSNRILRTIEQHDRDFARQSPPPAQNHLRRVSSMTWDFYWQSRTGPRPRSPSLSKTTTSTDKGERLCL